MGEETCETHYWKVEIDSETLNYKYVVVPVMRKDSTVDLQASPIELQYEPNRVV